MKTAFHKLIVSVFLVMAGLLAFAVNASAQACTVTVSIGSSGTSTTCFVPHSGAAYANITGTWTGTVTIQRSDDGAATWINQEVTTVNEFLALPVRANDTRYRVIAANSSGTTTGTITYTPNISARLKYETVPIGSVAYGSMGISVVNSTTSSGSADLIVGAPFTSTGCGLLIGGTGGTDSLICALYDSTGLLVANTAVAGTLASSTTNAFQEIAWTSAVTLAPGRYVLVFQANGTTVTIRRPASLTFVNVATSSIVSVFGTISPAITVPTSAASSIAAGGTNLIGPIGYIY